MNQPVIAVTSGEPAGIGPELCLKLAAWSGLGHPVVLGDRALLRQRADQLGLDVVLRDFSPSVSANSPTDATIKTTAGPRTIKTIAGPRVDRRTRRFFHGRRIYRFPQCFDRLMRAHHTGQRTLVGQGQRRIALRRRLPDQFVRMRGAAQEAEVGQAVQLGVIRECTTFGR
jgi:hypothetical protein